MLGSKVVDEQHHRIVELFDHLGLLVVMVGDPFENEDVLVELPLEFLRLTDKIFQLPHPWLAVELSTQLALYPFKLIDIRHPMLNIRLTPLPCWEVIDLIDMEPLAGKMRRALLTIRQSLSINLNMILTYLIKMVCAPSVACCFGLVENVVSLILDPLLGTDDDSVVIVDFVGGYAGFASGGADDG